MKFTAAAFLSAFGMANANKSSALRNAIPVNIDGSHRSLQDAAFQITVDYSIVYNSCISLKVYDDNLFAGGAIQKLAEAGDVMAERSYILFNAVETANVVYDSGSDENLYMMSVADWFDAVSDDDAQDDNEFCEACARSYDYCAAAEAAAAYDAAAGDAAAEGDGDAAAADEAADGDAAADDGARKLQRKAASARAKRAALDALMGERKLETEACVVTVTCEECATEGCFNNNNADGQQQNQEAAEGDEAVEYCDQNAYVDGCTIQEADMQNFMQAAACVDTGVVWTDDDGNDFNAYAGFICDPYGSGIQIAVFLNDGCTIYNKNLSFQKLASGTYVYALFVATKENIKQPYQQAIDCLACNYAAIQDDGDGNDQQHQGEAEINGVCQAVMQEAMDIETCSGNAQNEAAAADDGVDRSWYTANIESADVALADVCYFVKEHSTELKNYTVYEGQNEKGGGGFFFDYEKSGSGQKNHKAGKIIGIIAGICLIIVAGVLIGQSFAKKDSKKVPLVGGTKGNGAMA